MTKEDGGARTNEEEARAQSYRRLLARLILYDIEGQEALSDGAKEFPKKKKESAAPTRSKSMPANIDLKPVTEPVGTLVGR